ncbi:MAG: alpha/beta fold hydrolase [Byssovorax sp.]
MRRSTFLSLPLAAALSVSACGSDSPAPTPPTPPAYAPPPASTVVDEGEVKIRREVFLVPGVKPPKNPVAAANAETPAELDFVRVVRYRVDADPPKPARAIAVLMPGFLGGAGSYDPMARAIVRRSAGDDAYEAWAIDRRSNLLEDHHGLEVAQVKKDPEIALGYYFEEGEAEGKKFKGFLQSEDVAFESEWGLATTVGDLAAVIGVVAEADRKARVVLVGHSLGASIVEEYAAWDFAGKPGYAELAGLVLIDGMTRNEGGAAPPLTKDEYLKGKSDGFFSTPGLEAVRAGAPYVALPFLGLDIYPVAAITAMRSRLSPGKIVKDFHRDKAFQTLLSLTSVPKMTNRGAMGLGFDNESNGVSFAAVSCGTSKGGATEKYASLLGSTLSHPSDPDATYDWVEFDQTNPKDHTSIDDIARSWYEGPGLDFAEWYFPARLAGDAPAAGTLVLKPGDWPLDEQGLRATHGAEMDLPILGAVAGLVGDLKALEPLRALVKDVPIGAGRPLAGTPRSAEDAFRVVDITALTHIDPLSGTDVGNGLVPQWYDTLTAWMKTNTPSGGVVVPVQKAP